MTEKDPRRLFTPRQRFSLWVRAGARCEICGIVLDSAWEAHHIVPHSNGGWTEQFNGRALCLTCHQREHRMTTGKFKRDYETWQNQAVERLIERIDEFYSPTPGQFKNAYVVQVSPSGGKSVFSMKAAARLIEAERIDKAFFVVPRRSIKIGYQDDAELVYIGDRKFRIDTDLKPNYRGLLRNIDGVVLTYQSLPGLVDYFEMLVAAGRRLLFVFDEAHHGASGDVGEDDVTGDDDDTANVWGHAMTVIGNLACSVIAMTGTPVRTDQKQVPHFRYEDKLSTDPVAGKITRGRYVKADYVLSYKDAVEYGVARKLIIRNVDVAVTGIEGANDESPVEVTERLSEMSSRRVERSKRILSSQQGGTVDDMLKVAKDENERHRRTGDKDAAVLIVVASTGRDGKNQIPIVAERVRAIFGEDPATVESADGEIAHQVIKAFKRGTGRVIIAKSMISEGTSIPRIRVVCILRDIKSQVFYEQLVHRATRNDSDEVPQDAIVVQWRLPTLYRFGCIIEDETRMLVLKPKPRCPGCGGELEFKPRSDAPCPLCGYVPEATGGGVGNDDDDYLAIAAAVDGEEVRQGGEDFTKWDPTGRKIFDMLGPNPRFGGRDGINEILRLADVGGFMSQTNEMQPAERVFTDDELMQRCWDVGLKNCRKAGMTLAKFRGTPVDETIRRVISACKRVAGMGSADLNKVRREFPNPLETMQRFLKATETAVQNANAERREQGALV